MAAIALSLMMSGAIVLIGAPNEGDESLSAPADDPLHGRIVALLPHDPLTINGNSGFTSENGVVSGAGTELDPYMIEGWAINATGDNGIEVRNADAYFTIGNCYVYDGGTDFYGVSIEGCDNATLEGNILSNNLAGVMCLSCDGSVIVGNSFSGDGLGGILLDSCRNMTLGQNEFAGSGISFCDTMVLADHNTHTIDTTNTVNGDPVYYYKDQSGVIVPDDAGLVIMANCSDSRVENLNLSDTCFGLQMSFSQGLNVVSNTFDSDFAGICIMMCEQCVLAHNTMLDSGHTGIHGFGLMNCTLDGNTVQDPVSMGFYCIAVLNGTIVDNCCSGGFYGLTLWSAHGTMVGNNSCTGCYAGLVTEFCHNSTFVNNTCSFNSAYGMLLSYAEDNEVRSNTFEDNGMWGLILAFSSRNRVFGNAFIGNNGATDTYSPSAIQAMDNSPGNWWNSSDGRGNYWSDWTSPDLNMDGIVDNPYVLEGSVGAQDLYPLTTPLVPIPEFSMPMVLVILTLTVTFLAGAERKKRRKQ